VLLKEGRPKALLEVGCGRSSTFFADYAHAYSATYIGIENDLRWFNKTELDISLLGFNTRHLVHVPLSADGCWYDIDEFRVVTRNPGRFDFAFIDGPNEKRFFPNEAAVANHFRPEDGNPFGHRDDPSGLTAIKSVTQDCDVMIVDDVHKQHVFGTVDRMLSEPEAYEKYYFLYHPNPALNNALCICIKRNSSLIKRLPAMLDFLGVQLERQYRPQDAPSTFRRLLSKFATPFTTGPLKKN
jgi:hypothetical protein